jgi:hypothetical protein
MQPIVVDLAGYRAWYKKAVPGGIWLIEAGEEFFQTGNVRKDESAPGGMMVPFTTDSGHGGILPIAFVYKPKVNQYKLEVITEHTPEGIPYQAYKRIE